MIKVTYQNTTWDLYTYEDNLVLIDSNLKLERVIIKRDDFDRFFEQRKITFFDNYREQNQILKKVFIDDLDKLSERSLVKIEILRKYIKIESNEKMKFCKYIVEEFDYGFTETTIYRLITDFERNFKTMSFLLPKKQIRKSRLPKRVQDVIICFIKRKYANPQRINIKHLYELIKIELYSIPVEKKYIPSYVTVCNYIQKYSDVFEIEKKRLGTKEHYKRFAPVFNGVNTTYPLERAEIDHTVLDIVVYVIDEDGQKIYLEARPILTVIKDHYTKAFLGYYLTFLAPNTEISLKCLKHAMQKKLKKYENISETWIQYGRLKEIVADNASEFKSHKFEQVCYQLGINLVYSSSYEPWLKGTVESAFNNIGPLLERLPSRVRKDIIVGQKIEDTKISFESLDYLLNLWIICVYHNKYINSIKNSPNKLWLEKKLDEKVLDEELTNIDFELMDYEKIERMLSRKGIQFLNVRYNSSELNSLFLKNKKINKQTLKSKFLLNSEDISYIYVFDELAGIYLKVMNISGIPVGYSLRDLKTRNSELNREKNEINNLHDEKLILFNNEVKKVFKKNKYDKKLLRAKKISSDQTSIRTPKRYVEIENNESIYDIGGDFEDDH